MAAVRIEGPAGDESSISMEEIRHQAITLSSRGFGQGVRTLGITPVNAATRDAEPGRKRRRGATE
ncbi:MAG: hypothetical protein ACT4OO_08410 [Nitrospiraceae bacterium]